MQQREQEQINNRFPCSHSLGVGVGSLFLWGGGRGMSRGRAGGMLRRFAHLSGGVLEKAMAPHSSTLAWKSPWTEEPGRLQSIGSLRVGHD